MLLPWGPPAWHLCAVAYGLGALYQGTWAWQCLAKELPKTSLKLCITTCRVSVLLAREIWTESQMRGCNIRKNSLCFIMEAIWQHPVRFSSTEHMAYYLSSRISVKENWYTFSHYALLKCRLKRTTGPFIFMTQLVPLCSFSVNHSLSKDFFAWAQL